MALAGDDGQKAAELLRTSIRQGAAKLGMLTRAAVERLLADPQQALQADRLFTDEEREELGKVLASTNATADLLGRARIRKKLEQSEKFSEDAEGHEHGTDGKFVSKSGGESERKNALDRKIKHQRSPVHQQDWEETHREFLQRLNKAVDARPDKAVFHDPERLKVENELMQLAGPHAERLFLPHGGTLIAGKHTTLALWLDEPGVIRIHDMSTETRRRGIHGPDPRNPGSTYITANMPPEERDYRLRQALELPTTKEERRKYQLQDKAERTRRREERRTNHTQNHAQQHAEQFSDATPFTCFAEPIKPFAPLKALEYFRRLIPGLNPDPGQFSRTHEREGFNLAVSTDKTLLERIQEIIGKVLETGEGDARRTPRLIDAVLDAAGVTPKNPQYAEMVLRTNMMDAYNRGSEEEMKELADDFPAWRYVGIRDGRQGKDHEPHFDKYFPSSRSFAEVRGPRLFNCRCSFQPIHRNQWRRLQAQGARFSSFADKFAEVEDTERLLDVPNVRQLHNFDCGAGSTLSVARYFGVAGKRQEEDMIRELDTTPTSIIENGTRWQNIVRWFEKAGVAAEAHRNMTLDDLRRFVAKGRPVIVALQDYGTKEEYRDNESGHYVVVCGFYQGHVVIQDPSAANAEAGGRLPDHFPDSIQDFGKLLVREKVFLDAWHDSDQDGTVLTRFGIAVGPARHSKFSDAGLYADLARFADDAWITIGGKEEGDKKHKGGVPVLIDKGTGEIKGGKVPKSLQGTKVGDFKGNIEKHRRGEKIGEKSPSPIDNPSPIGDNTSGGGEKPKPEEPKMTTTTQEPLKRQPNESAIDFLGRFAANPGAAQEWVDISRAINGMKDHPDEIAQAEQLFGLDASQRDRFSPTTHVFQAAKQRYDEATAERGREERTNKARDLLQQIDTTDKPDKLMTEWAKLTGGMGMMGVSDQQKERLAQDLGIEVGPKGVSSALYDYFEKKLEPAKERVRLANAKDRVGKLYENPKTYGLTKRDLPKEMPVDGLVQSVDAQQDHRTGGFVARKKGDVIGDRVVLATSGIQTMRDPELGILGRRQWVLTAPASQEQIALSKVPAAIQHWEGRAKPSDDYNVGGYRTEEDKREAEAWIARYRSEPLAAHYAEQTGLPPDTPVGVIAGKLEELGQGEAAELLRKRGAKRGKKTIGDNTSGGGNELKPEEPKMTTQELPKLVGTEKQTDWADKIRTTALRGGVLEQELLRAASQHTDASWWIENRNNARNVLLDSALKPDESGIKSGGNGTPANARSAFYDIVSSPKPADEKKERMQAKTALTNAAWGGIQPSFAADKLIQADYPQAVIIAAMESRLSYFADASDDFTPEKIVSLQQDIQAWLNAKGGAA